MSLQGVHCKGGHGYEDRCGAEQGGLHDFYVGLLANLNELQVAQGEYALFEGVLPSVKLDGFDACRT